MACLAFHYNPDGLVLLNVAHGIYPRYPFDETRMQRPARQLNAARATFRGYGRTYHGGLKKFEPREMEDLPVFQEHRVCVGAPATSMPIRRIPARRSRQIPSDSRDRSEALDPFGGMNRRGGERHDPAVDATGRAARDVRPILIWHSRHHLK